jgi:hypothetical protein
VADEMGPYHNHLAVCGLKVLHACFD